MTAETNSRLHWLKYNPSEWQGRTFALSDAEYGLFHRTLEILWRTPGNRVSKVDLVSRLRITSGSDRATCLESLLAGQELRIDTDGMIDIPDLHAEFADACKRGEDAAKGGRAKAAKARAVPQPEEIDF